MHPYFLLKQKIQAFIFVFMCVFSLLAEPLLASSSPLKYEQAKKDLAELMHDKKRSEYRHHWMSIAGDFFAVYEDNPTWPNRVASLYRGAKCYDEMARRSYVPADATKAISYYAELVKKHKHSVLADDSLYAISLIYKDVLKNKEKRVESLEFLIKSYPNGDFAPKARQDLEVLLGKKNVSSKMEQVLKDAKKSQVPELDRTNWKAPITLQKISPHVYKNSIRISLFLDKIRANNWGRAYYVLAEKDKREGLFISLKDVAPSQQIKLEQEFKKSGIFKNYSIQYDAKEKTSFIHLGFSDISYYAVKTEAKPARLIIDVSLKANVIPKAFDVRHVARDAEKEKAKALSSQKSSQVKSQAKTETKTQAKAVAKKSKGIDYDAVVEQYKKHAASFHLPVKRIILDPGHGGRDPGTCSGNMRESTLNLDIAKRLAGVLRRAGYEVILTRTKDVTMSLESRIAFAHKHKGDLFISIHVNSNDNPRIRGFETYYFDKRAHKTPTKIGHTGKAIIIRDRKSADLYDRYVNSERRKESHILAKSIQLDTVRKLKNSKYDVINRGYRTASYYVIANTQIPAVLVEVAYSSNIDDAKLLKSRAFKDSAAEGIANGIHHYAKQRVK